MLPRTDKAAHIIKEIQNNLQGLHLVIVSEYDLSRLEKANQILKAFISKQRFNPL